MFFSGFAAANMMRTAAMQQKLMASSMNNKVKHKSPHQHDHGKVVTTYEHKPLTHEEALELWEKIHSKDHVHLQVEKVVEPVKKSMSEGLIFFLCFLTALVITLIAII